MILCDITLEYLLEPKFYSELIQQKEIFQHYLKKYHVTPSES